MRFDGQTVLITGAASGIGLACAERFASEGARLVLADVDAERGRHHADRLGTTVPTLFVACDVGITAQVDEVIGRALDRFGRIDRLINNAGIVKRYDFLDLPESDFDLVMRTNLKSVFLFSQRVARHMVSRGGGGAIVNMSSSSVLMTTPTHPAYAASKGGVSALTTAMSLSLAPHGIRVNAVGPGTIVTGLNRNSLLSDKENRRMILSRIPLGRFGRAEEVASVIAFLASDDASYITGQTLYIDGGRSGLNYTVPVSDAALSDLSFG